VDANRFVTFASSTALPLFLALSGKFISLQFSPDLSYTLVGAFVTTYLLEKTRVCYQVRGCEHAAAAAAAGRLSLLNDCYGSHVSFSSCLLSQMLGERNYHIFYDLLSGMAGDSSLCLEPSPMEYFYLNQSVAKGQACEGGEKGMFEHVCHAMEVIGIKEEQQRDLWKVLAGVLHLGNTSIIEADTVEGLKAEIQVGDKPQLRKAMNPVCGSIIVCRLNCHHGDSLILNS